ncbi:hypothetical protein [Runella limosa]|uniref:hypothetical protein n=1 Tax=Runella limosa TaxID=370978 RepID=UPI0012F7D127|nr:hypothetical protein [Runella limosa]
MEKLLTNFANNTLNRMQMKEVRGGDNPLWCGTTWYSCTCGNGTSSFTAHMGTSTELAEAANVYCGEVLGVLCEC